MNIITDGNKRTIDQVFSHQLVPEKFVFERCVERVPCKNYTVVREGSLANLAVTHIFLQHGLFPSDDCYGIWGNPHGCVSYTPLPHPGEGRGVYDTHPWGIPDLAIFCSLAHLSTSLLHKKCYRLQCRRFR